MIRPVIFFGLCSMLLVAADPKQTDVLAKLDGPSTAKVGQQLKYSTEGSVGQDIKFSLSPPSPGFEAVKLMDGKDTPGVIFTPSSPGTYYIYVMLNANSKTAFATQILTVEGTIPLPDPVKPDSPYFELREAIKLDKASDPQAPQYIAQFEAVVGQFGTIADNTTNWAQFNSVLKDAAKTALGDKIPETRKAVSQYIASKFPKDGNAPFDRAIIKTIQREILQTFKVSK